MDIYKDLRELIATGALPADTALTELSLAAQYNVSRTPVREALRRLEQDGLVQRGPRGMQVRGRSPEEILEIYEVRITLEGAAARAAAERRTELDLLKLEQIHAMMTAASEDDPNLAKANLTFHETVWAMSHNATLVDLLSRLHVHLVRYSETTLTYPDRWQKALEEHQRLIDAIKARNRRAAGQIAEGHMTAARNVRLAMYAAIDETFAF